MSSPYYCSISSLPSISNSHFPIIYLIHVKKNVIFNNLYKLLPFGTKFRLHHFWFIFTSTIPDWCQNSDSAYESLTSFFNVSSLKGFGCEDLKVGITAGGGLIYHIHTNLNNI